VLTAVPKVHWIDVGRGEGTAVTEPGHVRVTTTGGIVHEARSDIPLGNPSRPMTLEQLRRKFIDCAANAVRPIERSRAETIAGMVTRLETASDIGTLMHLLA
jgi:2-methylcitrate dehydratase PrpD